MVAGPRAGALTTAVAKFGWLTLARKAMDPRNSRELASTPSTDSRTVVPLWPSFLIAESDVTPMYILSSMGSPFR